jgi:hypothetical protein
VEDAATAVIHLASDPELNGTSATSGRLSIAIKLTMRNPGRGLAIMPRVMCADGYVDLQLDDSEQSALMSDLQGKIDNVSIRVGTK